MPVEYRTDVTYASLRPYFVRRTRAVARAVSNALRDNIKAEIPASKGDRVGEWKGWEASGRLHKDIVTVGDKRRGEDWVAGARLREGSLAKIYAGIHEKGGTIIAKTSGGMWFRGKNRSTGADLGPMNRAKVTIRPKNYMAKGRAATVSEMNRILLPFNTGRRLN